jgi:hypothetical protein
MRWQFNTNVSNYQRIKKINAVNAFDVFDIETPLRRRVASPKVGDLTTFCRFGAAESLKRKAF